MALQAITATDPETKAEVTYEFDFGDNLDHARSLFGEAVVFSNYQQKAIISLQAALRSLQKKGLSQDQITEKLRSLKWKPGVRTPRGPVDTKAAMIEKFISMNDEEKAEFLETLRARAANQAYGADASS